MKRSLFILLSFFAFSAFADESENPCYWDIYQGVSGEWHYSIICWPFSGGGGGGGDAQTNYTFTCTNCTAMTPAFCAELKANLQLSVSSLFANIDSVSNSLITLLSQYAVLEGEISVLKQEGESFTIIDREYALDYSLSSLSTYSYLTTSENTQLTQGGTISGAGNNSIYKYYNTAVKPVLESAANQIDSYKSATENAIYNVGNLNSDVNGFSSYVDSLNCSSCQSSQTITLPSSPSGGGGGGSSASCPCSELLGQILAVLQTMKTDLNNIKLRLDGWDTSIQNIESYLNQIQSDVYKIRRTTDLMDDFFKDDTEFNFKKLIEHTLTLSNAVFTADSKLPKNLYWTDYTNATQFLTDDGSSLDWLDTGRKISSPIEGAAIDFGEYTSLNWFQRIEYLLGNIAGIFSETNGVEDSDFTSSQKAEQDQVKLSVSSSSYGLDSHVSPVRSVLSQLQSAKTKLNPFSGVFNSYSSEKITLLPNVSLGSASNFNSLISDQEIPTIEIDLQQAGNGRYTLNDLVSLCHSITTFLWFVFLLLLDVFAFILFFRILVKIFEWYHKIGMAWAHSLLTGGAS